MPAHRKYPVPAGLKRVRRELADGTERIYWYHLATGQRLQADPMTPEGLQEARDRDARSGAISATDAAPARSLALLWASYRQGEEWRALKPRTRSDYQAVRDWLGEAAEKAIVVRIQTPHIIALRDKAAKEKGRRFGNYVVAVLRLVLEWGRVRGWRTDNPARGKLALRRMTGARVVNRAWSDAEVRAFLAAAPAQIALPFCLGLFAGMRQGDALKVTWRSYDGAALRWIAGKNGEPCMAPVTGTLKKALNAAKKHRGTSVQIATTLAGQAWTESGYRASFFKLVRLLTDAGHLQPGCTFHGLRHTIASGAVNDGESDRRIAHAIGDRTPGMAAIYGRDADRADAQTTILEAHQQRFGNAEGKLMGKRRRRSGADK